MSHARRQLTGEDVNPTVSSHRQEEKPGEAWVQFDQVPKDPVCFQIVH